MCGGSRSSSTTEQKTTQTTSQKSADGYVGGNVVQGESVTINEEFGAGVQDAFAQLIDLASKSIDTVSKTSTQAFQDLAEVKTELANPQLVEGKNLSPVLYIAAIGAVLFVIVRGLK
jgi:hypothetical protein